MLFLPEADHATQRDTIDQMLRQELPGEIRGYPTRFGRHKDGTAVMTADDDNSIPQEAAPQNGALLLTARRFFTSVLQFDPMGEIRPVDWLSAPGNCLLMLTSGRVFHDGLGQGAAPGGLEFIRARRAVPSDLVFARQLPLAFRAAVLVLELGGEIGLQPAVKRPRSGQVRA